MTRAGVVLAVTAGLAVTVGAVMLVRRGRAEARRRVPELPPPEPGRRRILVVGDSITVGYLPKFRKLAEAAGHEVIGEGKVSAQTTAIRSLMQPYLKQQPTDVVVLGGVNDLASGVGAFKVNLRLTDLWLDARKAGARVIAVLVTPWGCYSRYKAEDTAKVNDFIRKVVGNKAGPDVVVDASAVLGDAAGCLRFTRDKLHPNADGQALLAQAVMNAF